MMYDRYDVWGCIWPDKDTLRGASGLKFIVAYWGKGYAWFGCCCATVPGRNRCNKGLGS